MYWFDFEVIHAINQLSQHSIVFDKVMVLFFYNRLLKGGVFAMLLWWVWFGDSDKVHHRKYIILILCISFVVMVFATLLVSKLPFHPKPCCQEGLDFLMPYGIYSKVLSGMSSSVSTHALFFFALSTGLLFVSRKIGLIALFYTLLLILFPQLYLGSHYLSDLLLGAGIGGSMMVVGIGVLKRVKMIEEVVEYSHRNSAIFYPLFFIVTLQLSRMFDESIGLLRLLYQVVW